ncbi:hypothetical protein K9K77_00300 [Candidatus Babeliales bacterium]|nr:hypothetical protein [Candidatus Babeliales bacterium]
MKRKTFIALFITTHILFIAFQIDKQSRLVKLSYEKQRNETEKQKLLALKQKLTVELYEIKKQDTIKTFAHNSLHMKSLDLKKIKRIS